MARLLSSLERSRQTFKTADGNWEQEAAVGTCPRFILQGLAGLSLCFLVCREMGRCRCSEATKGSR